MRASAQREGETVGVPESDPRARSARPMMCRVAGPGLFAAAVLLGACAGTDSGRGADAPVPAPGLKELFPHVRFDKSARIVEIDGKVPIDCHNPKTPRVYLDV